MSKNICDGCKTKKNLFLVEFTTQHNFFCNTCLIPILKENPDTILKIYRVDNTYYDIELKKEVEKID